MRVLVRRSHSQNNNNQFLSLVTVLLLPTDKKERPRPIQNELRITILQLLDGVLSVAVVVIVFVHHQHRVRPFFILENESIIDLKPVSPSPVIVRLGGLQYPSIFSTNAELISLGGT